MSNSQLKLLKSEIKNGTELNTNLSLNRIGHSDNEYHFPHNLLLTNTQVSRLCKAFANNLSANTKLLKTQLHKIEQSGGFLGRLLGPLLKNGMSLMKNVLRTLAKSVLMPLGLTGAASTTDAAVRKKIFETFFRYNYTNNVKWRNE